MRTRLLAGVLLANLVFPLWGQETALPAEWILPSWQPADEVLTESGSIDWSRMSPHSRDVWEKAIGKDKCLVDSSWQEGGRGPRFPKQPPENRAQDALAVVTAVVVSQTPGLYFGDPATELQGRVLDAKGKDRSLAVAIPKDIRVIYPVARIETATGVLCRTTPGFESRPVVGQTVTLFLREGAQTDNPGVFLFSYPDWTWDSAGRD